MTRKQFLLENSKKYKKLLKIRYDADGNPITPYPLMTMREKYLAQEIYKIGVLDIETTGLGADFGRMLSWAILVRDVVTGEETIRSGVVNESDHRKAKGDADLIDKRITEELIEAISDLDYLVGHWFIGKRRHDIPFIRSRCAINKVHGFPKHKMVRYADTQRFSSQLHRLRNNGLGTIADAYDLAIHKTPVTTKDWKNAQQFANRKALRYILHHNILDVQITSKVLKHLEQYIGISSIFA
ncbi:MAG: hypothetical protein KGH65_05815 [Candidatus Micrarchaeota archaeon]|nr:hypothetical protein [Candidatus Micrarchaeota archaeon]